jgi:membrane fusion protein (multidrug efflux system)
MRFGKAAQAAGPPPEAVGTAMAKGAEWESVLESVGASRRAAGSRSAPRSPASCAPSASTRGEGARRAGPRRAGRQRRTGAAVVAPGAAEPRHDVSRAHPSPGSGRRRHQGAARDRRGQLQTVSADARALEAQIEKKTIRAPFGGKLGIRSVNLGQYLNPGTAITVLESLDAVYIDFTVPSSRSPACRSAPPCASPCPTRSPRRRWPARSPHRSERRPVTRAVKLRASVDRRRSAAELRPGTVRQRLGRAARPGKRRLRAGHGDHAPPYGNSVYIVEDKKGRSLAAKPARCARQQFVRIGVSRGDFVAIDEGVTAGQEVVTLGAFKLRNGAPVLREQRDPASALANSQPQNR